MVFGSPMPEKIGRYEIVLQIARGGMATVYLARAEGHGGFDRYVALKLTAEHLRDDPEFAQHLVEEAKLVAHLRHTNVVPVLDVGEDEMGAVFLVMEYVPGDSLGGLVRTAKKQSAFVPPRIGLRIVVDALQGLHAAHEHVDEDGKPHSLVHRDFSPQNILVGTDGIARLTDFGIAKATSRASITVAGTMKGKVSYASPEQARGKTLDRRCDVWAAGVVAWEVIIGRKLYPSTERTLLDIVKGPPPRVREVLPDIPQEIDDVIARALAMEVEARTPTALMFARELTNAARNAGMLAEVEEVAEHVKHAVAPILAERKEKIAEARKTREAAQSSPTLNDYGLPSSLDAQGDPSSASYQGATVPLPSLPEIPMVTRRLDNAPTVPASVANELMSQSGSNPIAVWGGPDGSAMAPSASSTRMLGGSLTVPAPHSSSSSLAMQGGGAPNDDRPSSFTPSGTPSGVSRPAFSGRSSYKSLVELKATIVDRITYYIAKKPAVVIGGASAIAAALILTAVIVLVATGGSKTANTSANASTDPMTASSGTLSAQQASPTATSSSTAVTNTTTAPKRSSLGDPEPLPPQLVLSANGPIARVRIGKRVTELDVPAPEVAVDLTPDENATTITVTATSTDGRSGTTTWNPGDTKAAITFGEAPSAPAAPTPPPPVKKGGKPRKKK